MSSSDTLLKSSTLILISNYKADEQMSMLLFSQMLAREVASRGMRVNIFSPKVIVGKFFKGSPLLSKWFGYIDKYLLFPLYLWIRILIESRKARLLIHICDHSNAVYLPFIRRTPHLITCHDVMAVKVGLTGFLGMKSGLMGRILQKWIFSGLVRARNIVCVSSKTESDLKELLPSTHSVRGVILMGLNFEYERMSAVDVSDVLRESKFPVGKRSVLHVGDNSWYKNRDGILRCCAYLKGRQKEGCPYFVFAGKELEDSHRALIKELGIEDRVVSLGRLTGLELEAAYSAADVFLFPSHCEGFGWPPIEAQSCGCPVVASAGGALAEVLDHSVLKVDPDSVESMANAVWDLLNNEKLRNELISQGYQNVKRFNTKKMVDRYMDVYQSILVTESGVD